MIAAMPHKTSFSSELFATPEASRSQPLAARMRPASLDEMVGQDRLLGEGRPLRRALEAGHVHSMLLWGPPGCGKTTLALLIARYVDADFCAISAVLSGLSDVRKALSEAETRSIRGRRTVLFVDEVHRFNKAQQDAFLPHIERGVIVFVGATTENPSFELNTALLSRCCVHLLEAVSVADIVLMLRRALSDKERGLGDRGLQIADDALESIAHAADGDVRRALSLIDIAAEMAVNRCIDAPVLAQVLADRSRRFDKKGEQFYDQISALHKSVRSSDPDAAVYWLARMMDGGCDGAYLCRRMTRMAVEDVGLAEPRAWRMALDAWDTYEHLGSPEGELALAQLAIWLAVAPKSNAVYTAWNQACDAVRNMGSLEVPIHLRNAPTRLLKELGYGKDYQYDHDCKEGIALDQQCLPGPLEDRVFYAPVERGMELKLREKLNVLRARRRQARGKS